MNNYTFKAHPITIFYLLRSWWFLFTAPVVRIVLQYVISNQAQQILLSEVVLLTFAVIISISGWFFTKIVINGSQLTIKRGVFVKKSLSIDCLGLCGVSAGKNLFYSIIGCSNCLIATQVKNDKQCKVHLKTRDELNLFDVLYKNGQYQPLKRQKLLRRYFIAPIWATAITVLAVLVIYLAVGNITAYQGCFALSVLLLIALYSSYCYYDYKKGTLCVGKNIFAQGIGFFCIKRFCCNKTDVATIKIIQSPFDRRHNTCKIRITTRGEGGSSIKIKHLERDNIITQMQNALNVYPNA